MLRFVPHFDQSAMTFSISEYPLAFINATSNFIANGCLIFAQKPRYIGQNHICCVCRRIERNIITTEGEFKFCFCLVFGNELFHVIVQKKSSADTFHSEEN